MLFPKPEKPSSEPPKESITGAFQRTYFDQDDASERYRREYLRNHRLDRFRTVCPAEFYEKIDRSKLTNADAFDAVQKWDGTYPGPLLFGETSKAKTRAAWVSLGRLYTRDGLPFEFFTAERLLRAIEENRNGISHYLDYLRRWSELFFFDDLHRFNTAFESQGMALAQVYDWIYRNHIPAITTTNKPREWWTQLLGESTARRMFDEAHTLINF